MKRQTSHFVSSTSFDKWAGPYRKLSLTAKGTFDASIARLLAISVVCLMLLIATNLHAQIDLGQLTGRVRDLSGASLVGARVELTSRATAITRSAVTNSSGLYSFPGVPAGDYTLKITAPGFESTLLDASVKTGSSAAVDATLSVGSVTQQVNVTAPSDLQTDSFEVKTTLSSEDMTELPAVDGNPLSLALVAPGTAPGSDPSQNTSSAQFFLNTDTDVQLGGGQDVQTGYIEDGVQNVNLLTQTANILPSVQSIREMDVITNGADAHYRQPGVINITTRSGTKSVHGTAYDYLRNNYLNALPYNFSTVAPTATPLRYNRFGANIGGPLWRRRLFGFIDYQGVRSISTTSQLSLVPTAAQLQGDFSASTNLIYDPKSYKNGSTVSFLSETGKNAIPGGAAALDPFAVQYLKDYFPAANIPYNATQNANYQSAIAKTSKVDKYLARLDFDISKKDRAYAAFSYSDSPNVSPTFIPNLFGRVYEGKGVNVLAEENHEITSNLVITSRFGYNRSNYFETIQGAGAMNYVEHFGLNNLNPLPNQYAPPYVVISSNFSSVGYQNAPQGSIQNRFEFAEQFDIAVGRHFISLGGEVFKTFFDGNWVISNNGTYNYNGAFTAEYIKGAKNSVNAGIPLADFLLGYPNSASGATGVSTGRFRETEVAGFIQDNWRIFPRLTLNLGLRYQFDNPPHDADGHGSIYDVASNQNIAGTWRTNYGDWGPRVGFAFSPTTKTVIRGGAGIYYAGSPYNMLQFLLAHPPNFYTQAPTFQITSPTLAENVFSASPSAKGQQPQTLNEHMPDPNVQEFNLWVERQVAAAINVSAGYVGEIGRHDSVRLDANQPTSLSPGTTGFFNQGPYPYVGSVFQQSNIATENRKGLESKVRVHLKDGSHLLVSYAWSKSMNTSDGDRYPLTDSYHPNANYAPSAFDRTHIVSVSAVYHIPYGPHEKFGSSAGYVTRFALAGWQLSGIYQFATGLPVAVFGVNSFTTSSIQTIYAQKTCDPTKGYQFQRTRSSWWNKNCFVQPGSIQDAIGGRNGVRQPGIDNLNLSLGKTFLLTERQRLKFRLDMFNVPNHPQFSLPGKTSVGSGSSGVLSGTSRPMRNMQVALIYSF